MTLPRDYEDEAGDDVPLTGSWYADRFRVGQNAFEFKIDCGHESPTDDLVTVYLRIIANPANAQELFRLLGVALLRYSNAFGSIDDSEVDAPTRRDA